MKNGYKTIASIKKDCVSFADKVLETDFSQMDDDTLCVTADQAREPIETASAVTEVIFRKTGLKLFSCQLQTAYALYNGHIAELSTGEGKTLAGVVAAVMYVKSGRKVQVLVFNDYLAKRDATENQKIYEFCGVSVGYITEATPIRERAEQYEKDVLYISAREAGYDCIRNFVAYNESELTGGEYDVAIVDEADSILIDEASIPLILAGKAEDTSADEIKVMAEYAAQNGVSKEDIIGDPKGYSTYESMYRMVNELGFDKFTVVTQKYHLSRAMYSAKALGADVHGVAAEDIRYYGQLWRDIREVLARVKDFGLSAIKHEVK